MPNRQDAAVGDVWPGRRSHTDQAGCSRDQPGIDEEAYAKQRRANPMDRRRVSPGPQHCRVNRSREGVAAGGPRTQVRCGLGVPHQFRQADHLLSHFTGRSH